MDGKTIRGVVDDAGRKTHVLGASSSHGAATPLAQKKAVLTIKEDGSGTGKRPPTTSVPSSPHRCPGAPDFAAQSPQPARGRIEKREIWIATELAPAAAFLGLNPAGWAIVGGAAVLAVTLGSYFTLQTMRKLNDERKIGGLDPITLLQIFEEVELLESKSMQNILERLGEEMDNVSLSDNRQDAVIESYCQKWCSGGLKAGGISG